jgi:hypothetical protein
MARPKSSEPTLTGEGRKVATFVPLEVYRQLKRLAFRRAMETDTPVSVGAILREIVESQLDNGGQPATLANFPDASTAVSHERVPVGDQAAGAVAKASAKLIQGRAKRRHSSTPLTAATRHRLVGTLRA